MKRLAIVLGTLVAWVIGAGCASAPVSASRPVVHEPATSRPPAPPLGLPRPEIERMANGLELQWYVSDKLPLVDAVLVVRSGHRDDPPGKTGTCELLADLLDRGAGGMSAMEIAREIESLGASQWISADDDTVTLGFHGLSEDAPKLLDILGRMTVRPELSPAEFKRQRERLLDRWSHLADQGSSLAGVAFQRAIARGTSYGRGNILSAGELSRLGREDVVGFHKTHFTPANAILMVVGRVDRAEFRKRIEAAFGAWAGPKPGRHYTVFTDRRIPEPHDRILVVDRPGNNQAQVRMGFVAPPLSSPDHDALRVANALIGEYFNSRLNTVIRDRLGLTYGIGSSFAYSRDLGQFAIASSTRSETVGPLLDRALAILQELRSKGPLPDEVRMAKDYLTGGFPLGVSTLATVATRRLTDQLLGLPSDHLDLAVSRIQAVSQEEVAKAIRKHFRLDRLVTVVAGDTAEILKSLTPAQRKQVRRLSAADLR